MKTIPRIITGVFILSSANISTGAHAEDDARVEVSSFYFVNPRDPSLRVAEICGFVKVPMTANLRVLIKADPGANEEHYTAIPDFATSKWCHIIYTGRGRADVTLWSGDTGLASGRLVHVQAQLRTPE